MDLLKRIFALTGVVILLLCYVMSFITAILATEDAHNWFIASIGATLLIPTVLYAYSIILRASKRSDTESKLREDSYLRMMKAQIEKKKEKQSQEENAENQEQENYEEE